MKGKRRFKSFPLGEVKIQRHEIARRTTLLSPGKRYKTVVRVPVRDERFISSSSDERAISQSRLQNVGELLHPVNGGSSARKETCESVKEGRRWNGETSLVK